MFSQRFSQRNAIEQNREAVIADFKKWLDEHKEQVQAHTLDALPMEDLDDEWEG